MAGASPTIDSGGRILIQDSEGFFNGYPDIGSGTIMAAGTSPSGNDQDYAVYQGNNGDLWTTGSCGHGDTGLGMLAGTSPSISSDPGAIPINVIAGGPGNNRLKGSSGNDLIFGNRGNDIIDGRAGNDVIYGGPGNDVIYGGPGNDRIDGGSGNDVIYGGSGNDRIDGGPGNDRIVDHRRGRS